MQWYIYENVKYKIQDFLQLNYVGYEKLIAFIQIGIKASSLTSS